MVDFLIVQQVQKAIYTYAHTIVFLITYVYTSYASTIHTVILLSYMVHDYYVQSRRSMIQYLPIRRHAG